MLFVLKLLSIGMSITCLIGESSKMDTLFQRPYPDAFQALQIKPLAILIHRAHK